MSESLFVAVARDLRRAPLLYHGSRDDRSLASLRGAVIQQGRFGGRCHFCGLLFTGTDIFEIHHLDHDHDNTRLDNLAPVCEMCHAVLHIDLVAQRWPNDCGRLIFLPQVSQPELNNLLQVSFWAMALEPEDGGPQPGEEGGSEAPRTDGGVRAADGHPLSAAAARGRAHQLYAHLESLSGEIEKRLPGLSEPPALSRVLSGMDDETYAKRGQVFAGLRYLAPQAHFTVQARGLKGKDCALAYMGTRSWDRVLPEGGAPASTSEADA